MLFSTLQRTLRTEQENQFQYSHVRTFTLCRIWKRTILWVLPKINAIYVIFQNVPFFYHLTAIQNPCSAAIALCRSQISIPWGCTEETRTNNGTKSIAWFTVDAAHFLGKWTSFIDSRYNWKGRFNFSVSRWYGYHFNAYSSDSALLDEFTKVSIWWAKMPNNLRKL